MMNPLSPYQLVLIFPARGLPRARGRPFQKKGRCLLSSPDILHDQCQMLPLVDSYGYPPTLQKRVNTVYHTGDVIHDQFTESVVAPEGGPLHYSTVGAAP